MQNAKLKAELEVANSNKNQVAAVEAKESELSLLKFKIEDDIKAVEAEKSKIESSMKAFLADKLTFE